MRRIGNEVLNLSSLRTGLQHIPLAEERMRNDHFTAAAVVTHRRPTRRRCFMAIVPLILSGICLPRAAQATVVAYDTPLPSPPAPSSWVLGSSWNITAGGSTHIDVRAFQPDHNGTTAYYTARCGIDAPTTFVVDAGVATSGSTISPKNYNIAATASGNTLTFTLQSSQYIEINVPGKPTLCLLADPIEVNPPPSSGTGIYNVVTQYGADSTGVNSATTAIQNAINAANTAGGGTVYVPAGIFRSGKLTLKSNVSFYLADRAVLYANEASTWSKGGNHFVSATSVSNVKVFGRGTIDCRGAVISGGVNPSTAGGTVAQINPIFLGTTTTATVDGVVGNDSTGWTMETRNSTSNVTISNLKLINRQDWHWNDGIDLDSSHDITVSHCFVKTCDDAACVKTIKDSAGAANPSYNITENDMVMDTGVGCGFRIGNETVADIHDITATNFNVVSCHRGLDLTHWGNNSGGAGTWSMMHFRNFRVEAASGSGNAQPPNRGSYLLTPMRMETDNTGFGVGPITKIEVTRCQFDDYGQYAAYVWGNDATNNVNNICFTDMTIAGTAITGLGTTFPLVATAIFNGGNTSNITFNTDASAKTNECENLSFTEFGCNPTVYTDSRYSNSQTLAPNSTGTNQWIEVTLPSIPAGTYDVQLYYRGRNDHGQFQATMNGTALGTPGQIWDQYDATDTFGLINDLGPYTFFSAGSQKLRLTLTGKNANSTNYQLDLDKVVLNKLP
jgi:hypothetical protein